MPMKISSIVFAVLLAVSSVSGQWVEQSSQSASSPVAGLLYRTVRLEDAASGEVATVELAIFPVKSNLSLRLIDNPGGSADLAEAMPSAGCLAGVNGGYFDPSFAPLGLRVVDGKVVRPMIRARLMTGVLLSAPGTTQILRVGEYSARRKATAALQCGPLLVDGGRPVPGLDRTRLARRTFAAVAGDRAALGVCSESSLAGVAGILSTLRLADNAKVSRALNLDGGSSSAFWFKRSDARPVSISEMKSVRDFVGIAPR